MFAVDSSFGCGVGLGGEGDPQLGGVRRETWWYSEKTGQWGWAPEEPPANDVVFISATPMGHPFEAPHGFFRPVGGAETP